MVSTIKELSEDERIRLQCQAREDYERRLIGQFNQGVQQGMQQELESNAKIVADKFDIPYEKALELLKNK